MHLISSDRTNICLFGGHIGISISNKILSFAIRDKLFFVCESKRFYILKYNEKLSLEGLGL